jgi:hypothetical protein
MTFLYDNSLGTSKIGFFNEDVGSFTFDIFKQANELFAIRALKPSTVDEEMEIIFDAPGNKIKTNYNSVDIGLYLDFLNAKYALGRADGNDFDAGGIFGLKIEPDNQSIILGDDWISSQTQIVIDSSTSVITTKELGYEKGLKLDFANRNFYFGNDWQEATNLFGWFGMTAYAGSQQWNIKIKDTVDFNNLFTQFINVEEGFNQFVNSGNETSGFQQGSTQLYHSVTSPTYSSYVNLTNESFYVAISNNSTSVPTFFNLDGANQRLEVSDNLKSATAGGNSGQHLKIRVGSTDYKIQLLNP